MKKEIRLILALCVGLLLPSVAKADLILYGFVNSEVQLTSAGPNLVVGMTTYEFLGQNGAIEDHSHSGTGTMHDWNVGDALSFSTIATNGIDSEFALEMLFSFHNTGTTTQTAELNFNVDSTFYINLEDEGVTRSLIANGSGFIFDQTGSPAWFDTYHKERSGDILWQDSLGFPSNLSVSVTVDPGETAEVLALYNGKLTGNSITTAVPEPGSAVLFGALTIGNLTFRRRFRGTIAG